MVKVKGLDKHLNRVGRLSSPDANRQIARALYAGGQEIEIEAELSITQGSISGKGHIPSKPGEPPNADTRLLDGSIRTYLVSEVDPRSEVRSEAPYAKSLEFGSSKMAARPYMRPATAKKRKVAVALVERAVSNIIRGGGNG